MKKSNLNKDERIYIELEHKKHIIEEQLIKKRIDLRKSLGLTLTSIYF